MKNNKILKFLCSFFSVPLLKPPDLGSIRNIIIVRPHNQLGDMLTTDCIFRTLKENIPDCRITLVASPQNINAVKQNKYIDKIFCFDKKKILNPLYLFRFISSLRRTNYQLGLLPTTVSVSLTSSVILRITNCSYRIGPSSFNDSPLDFSGFFNNRIEYNWQMFNGWHISEITLFILRDFHFKSNSGKFHILLNQENQKYADYFFSNTKKLKIGLHIGAGKIQNRWDIDNFIKLIQLLHLKYNPLFYFSLGKDDLPLFEVLKTKLHIDYKIPEKQSIPFITAIISKSDLFISNDTGIMHCAGTTETPLICLFGPTDPVLWAPLGDTVHIIKNKEDINSIDVEKVFNTAVGILNEKNCHN